MTKEIKQKKQDLGIFYTDQRIADFIFGILKIWKAKEEKETGRWESRKHYPSVIDPAVGEGVFLKSALENEFTQPKYIFGVDIDKTAKESWVEINLLKAFGSRAELNVHFFHQNGLLPLDTKKVLRYKKGGLRDFDAVVGNPPYGGMGLGETKLTDDLVAQLANFEILPENVKNNLIVANTQSDLFDSDKQLAIKPDAKQRIKSFSIEILFIERFIQLAKPGGWIAIIIPDGILTNSNSHYVREFISKKAKVEAIVSLPRDAFKNVGTSAKTSILFLRKYKDQEEKQEDYFVFLASVDSLDEKNFNLVKDNYKNYYNKTMSNKNLVQTTTDEKGREIVMVRVDKTLKEMMEEKPAGRWDTKYWHPDYDELEELLNSFEYKVRNLGDFIPQGVEWITYGSTKPRQWSEVGSGVEYIKPGNVKFTGLDYASLLWTPEKGNLDSPNYRVKKNDLIVNKSGMGTWGRGIIITNEPDKMVVSQDTMKIRTRGISPYYVAVYLWSDFGHKQQDRNFVGVGSPHIDFDELRTIKIPELPQNVQKNIESEYKKMSKYHDIAMDAKKKSDEAEYKKNIETAEKMLKDLIAKTEAVVRGERKDVI